MVDLTKKVDFQQPPVVEVVCGAAFRLGAKLKAVDVGLFWQTIRTSFPRVEEVAPIPPIITPDGIFQIELGFNGNVPPLARSWLISQDGNRLLQVQGDRLLYNWKREQTDQTYPSFDSVYREFTRYLKKFEAFLRNQQFPDPAYEQFELNYVNNIGDGNGLSKVGANGVLIDHMRKSDGNRFLPMPEAFNWQTAYPLPNNQGRLQINAATAVVKGTGDQIVRLDMVARGKPEEPIRTNMDTWFELAHEWIVVGFCDATNPELHKIWGRTL